VTGRLPAAALLCALLVAAQAGCASRTPAAYAQAIDAAWKLERGKQYLEAAQAAGEAAAAAGVEADDREEALLFQARMLAKAGKPDGAAAILRGIVETTKDGGMRGRAIYDLGLLALAAGDGAGALARFLRLVKEHPDHGLASSALKKSMVIVGKEGGEGAVRELLEGLLPGALASSFGDDVLWELAKLEEKAGNLAAAKKHLLAIDASYPYPVGGAAFECLFMLADIAEEEGDLAGAVAWLEKIAATAEKSYVIGEYGDDAKAKALLAAGKIYLEKLGKPAEAYACFDRVVKLKWETRSDDGLWWASKARFAQGRDQEGCALLEKLVETYAYSNFRKESFAALAAPPCTSSN